MEKFTVLSLSDLVDIQGGKKRRNILGQTIVAWLNQVAD